MKVTADLRTITTSQTNLSKSIGVTPQQVYNLIKEKIVIRDEEDKSGAVFVFESLKNYYSSRNIGENGLNYWDEKAKHEKIKRETSELKLKKLKGKVYDARTVERVISENNVVVRTKLLGIAGKMSMELENKSKEEINEKLTAEIEEILNELSKYEPVKYRSEEVEE